MTTPVELLTPADFDHGLTLVHRGGEPSNYLHEVSYRDGNDGAAAFLADAGYRLKVTGWRKFGVQYWVCTKEFPLAVGDW